MEKKIILEITLSELRDLFREEFHSVLQSQKGNRPSEEGRMKSIMNITDACRYLNLSRSTIYKMTSQGTIPYRKPGKQLYFIKSELDAWIEEGKVDGLDDLRQDLEQHLHKNGRNSASPESQ